MNKYLTRSAIGLWSIRLFLCLCLQMISVPIVFAETLNVAAIRTLRATSQDVSLDPSLRDLAKIVLSVRLRRCQITELSKKNSMDAFIKKAVPDGKELIKDPTLAHELIQEFEAGQVNLGFDSKNDSLSQKSLLEKAGPTALGLVCQALGQDNLGTNDIINLAKTSTSVFDMLSMDSTHLVSKQQTKESEENCLSIEQFSDVSQTNLIHARCLSFRSLGEMGNDEILKILSDPGFQSRVTRIEFASASYDGFDFNSEILENLAKFKQLKEVQFEDIYFKSDEIQAFLDKTRDKLTSLELQDVSIQASQSNQRESKAQEESQSSQPQKKFALKNISIVRSQLPSKFYENIIKNSELTDVFVTYSRRESQGYIKGVIASPQTIHLSLSGVNLSKNDWSQQETLEHLEKWDLFYDRSADFDPIAFEQLLNKTLYLKELNLGFVRFSQNYFKTLKPLTHLKSIRIKGVIEGQENLDSLISKTPVLESLSLETDDIFNPQNEDSRQYPTVGALRLEVRSGMFVPQHPDKSLKYYLSKFPNLNSLELPRVADYSQIDKNTTVKTLRIGSTPTARVWNYELTSELIKKFSSLTTLELVPLYTVKNKHGVSEAIYPITEKGRLKIQAENPKLIIKRL